MTRRELSLEDGITLVRFVRSVLRSEALHEKGSYGNALLESITQYGKRAIYITIRSYPEREVLNCRGILHPKCKIKDEIVNIVRLILATSCNLLKERSLKDIVIEISVLDTPIFLKASKPSDYLSRIKIGHHGVIVKIGNSYGLLLPQACEGRDVEEVLCMACIKAGSEPDCWLKPRVKIYRFTAQIFTEIHPMGEIVELRPSESSNGFVKIERYDGVKD